MKKAIILGAILIIVGLLIFQNCLAVISNHYLAGVQIPDLWYDGIKANISYSNPNLVSNNDFSGECISLANTTGSWVEVGWMKDPSHIGANIPYAFFENVIVNQSVLYYPISATTHSYELVFVGRRADYAAVFRFYLDGNVMNGTGIMAEQDLWPQAKGEVYNSTTSYSDMGPASLSNIQLRWSGSYFPWKNQYPTLHTSAFADSPYQLIIFNEFYNISNRRKP